MGIIKIIFLGVISMKETVMENYIYLCWAQLWAMTFWYHDPEEKRYRFNQLLNVLDRLGQYEVNISFIIDFRLKYSICFSRALTNTAMNQ